MKLLSLGLLTSGIDSFVRDFFDFAFKAVGYVTDLIAESHVHSYRHEATVTCAGPTSPKVPEVSANC